MAIYNTAKTNRNKWSIIELPRSSRKSGLWKHLRKYDNKEYKEIGEEGYRLGLLGENFIAGERCMGGGVEYTLPYYSNIPDTQEFIEWAVQQLRLGRQIYQVRIKIRAMYFACNEDKYTKVVGQKRFKKINPHHPIKFSAINFGPARD